MNALCVLVAVALFRAPCINAVFDGFTHLNAFSYGYGGGDADPYGTDDSSQAVDWSSLSKFLFYGFNVCGYFI